MTAPSFFEKNFEKQEGIFENLLTYQQVCGILSQYLLTSQQIGQEFKVNSEIRSFYEEASTAPQKRV